MKAIYFISFIWTQSLFGSNRIFLHFRVIWITICRWVLLILLQSWTNFISTYSIKSYLYYIIHIYTYLLYVWFDLIHMNMPDKIPSWAEVLSKFLLGDGKITRKQDFSATGILFMVSLIHSPFARRSILSGDFVSTSEQEVSRSLLSQSFHSCHNSSTDLIYDLS